MIRLTCIHDARLPDTDVTYAIMRSYKARGDDFCVFQKAELSPSGNLFLAYTSWRNNGNWNHHTFDTEYVLEFIKEMAYSAEALKALTFLYDMDASGVNIELACACHDESLCHRSIVGGILLGLGANVECDSSYLKYFKMYQNTLLQKLK